MDRPELHALDSASPYFPTATLAAIRQYRRTAILRNTDESETCLPALDDLRKTQLKFPGGSLIMRRFTDVPAPKIFGAA